VSHPHQKVLEYLSHARDCSHLAGNATTDEHRKLLREMMKTWLTLAHEHGRTTGQILPSDIVTSLRALEQQYQERTKPLQPVPAKRNERDRPARVV
jgi:hypothetical protein